MNEAAQTGGSAVVEVQPPVVVVGVDIVVAVFEAKFLGNAGDAVVVVKIIRVLRQRGGPVISDSNAVGTAVRGAVDIRGLCKFGDARDQRIPFLLLKLILGAQLEDVGQKARGVAEQAHHS